MPDKETVSNQEVTSIAKSTRIPLRYFVQGTIVAAALVVAIVVVSSPGAAEDPMGGFNMLAYLDEQIATQENVKDVRCWSSFCKLQMFLTGAQIEQSAEAERIDAHMNLIQSIHEDAKKTSAGKEISDQSVTEILESRFPHTSTGSETTFNLDGGVGSISIIADTLEDYSDTIEPWRLIQTWASRHADRNGKLSIKPPFSEAALQVMYEFLRRYDLAILKHARSIARERKVASIDREVMAEAFMLEKKLRGNLE